MQQLFSFIEQNPIASAVFYVWVMAWKGYALWRAGGRKEKYWFIALLIINTLGILEILYLFVFSKDEIMKSLKAKFRKSPAAGIEPPKSV